LTLGAPTESLLYHYENGAPNIDSAWYRLALQDTIENMTRGLGI